MLIMQKYNMIYDDALYNISPPFVSQHPEVFPHVEV